MKRFAVLLALAPLGAHAQSVTPVKTVDCYCTDTSGSRVELGESICLQVGGRMFTAQCQMSLNVPMWRETQEGCVTGSLEQVLPFSPFEPDALQQPVEAFSIHSEV